MNWKTLYNPAEVMGEPILLRESHSFSQNITLVVGTIGMDCNGGYFIRDYDGKTFSLHEDYTYHFIKVNEILF